MPLNRLYFNYFKELFIHFYGIVMIYIYQNSALIDKFNFDTIPLYYTINPKPNNTPNKVMFRAVSPSTMFSSLPLLILTMCCHVFK